MSQCYDIIGDIHGHADALEALLSKLGYAKRDGAYRHASNKAVFLGDFIDRGPAQLRTVEIARAMVDAGDAHAVMGNHEFNAICYAAPFDGGYIRSHSERHTHQHHAFLNEAPLGSPRHEAAIAWFKTLPIRLDFGGFAVVHACWCEDEFDRLSAWLTPDGALTEDAYQAYAKKAPGMRAALEHVLKGPKVDLHPELHYTDKDGHRRSAARMNWWRGNDAPNRDRIDLMIENLTPEQHDVLDRSDFTGDYRTPEKPLFIGHYWRSGAPVLLNERLACLDYSVAKGGKLVAYRWRGESELDPTHFVWV